MSEHHAPQRPAEYAEETLVTAIVDGTYPPGSTLPGERQLAEQLGITRPTLREALQRLARDGWLTIQHGKSTVVNDFWREGGLNVLDTLVRYDLALPTTFVRALLEVRLAMAPAYARAAVEHDPGAVRAHLRDHTDLAATPEAYAAFDWTLHHTLTLASGNPIYPLILNGFAGFYEQMACRYFMSGEARAASTAFYAALLDAVEQGDADAAEQVTREVMRKSITLWEQLNAENAAEDKD
jgi:GntR family transcriptional regulator, negative regulator for fad regulon and positive regulator of fabA